VFAWPDGSLVNPTQFGRWFRSHCEAAGLPVIRLHDYPEICVIPISVCELLPCGVIGLFMSA
jgi:hypothetical protein